MNIKNIIKRILLIFPVRNIIIMESNPDFTDNTKKVFDKLIENRVNDKYKIVWFVYNPKEFKDIKIKNVKFVSMFSNCDLFKRLYYNYFAKIIIDSNKYIPKVRKEQFRLYLCHGTPLKNAGGYCEQIGEVDYILEIGDFFREKDCKLFNKSKEYFLDLGFPRNDDLLLNSKIDEVFPEFKGNKIIVWLPTYRKHKNDNSNTYTESIIKYGLPSINSSKDFENIDKVLKENNTIMLIKLHPAQDRGVIDSFKCNNIKVVTDEELIIRKTNLYKLLSISDALITDYSSVYYDYLITKKPIGLAITDIDEYEEKVGFAYNYYDTVKGEYIYNSNDLAKFITNIAKNKDEKRQERLRCLELYHTYCDGKSSERVYEFIKKYL